MISITVKHDFYINDHFLKKYDAVRKIKAEIDALKSIFIKY